MKKGLLLAIVLTAGFSALQAQSFKAGLKVGANLNKVTGQSFNDEFDLGYHAGAFLDLGLTKKIGIQPELIFNQINTKRTSGFNQIYNQNNMNPSDVQLRYISIPVLLRYDLAPFFSLNLGPQFGILINDKQNLFDNSRDAFKKGDLAAVGGATINLSSIRIYGRYAVGLNNINDIDNRDEWKSQQVQLGLGFTL